MKDRYAAQWEELARREPYFAVLTSEGDGRVDGNSVATASFFETGEADVAALMAGLTSLLARAIPMTSVLDFGCGAGRLTLPLARRAAAVVGCDIAPTVLEHARLNASKAGLHNVTFLLNDEIGDRGPFDFICSLFVLQYVPPAAGYAIIGDLIQALAPGGLAALHVMSRRGGHRRMEKLNFIQHLNDGRRQPSFLQVRRYEERGVLDALGAAGGHLRARLPTGAGHTAGAVWIVEKGEG